MSTSLPYHAMGLKTYECLRTEYVHSAIFFLFRRKRDTVLHPLPQPQCACRQGEAVLARGSHRSEADAHRRLLAHLEMPKVHCH
jgi:hypothetical protein